jgi:Ca2+-binding EF-hand superfamily protein
MRLVPTMLVLASANFILSGAGWAQGRATPYDPRAAFAEVDTNKDGQIDIEEFHVRLVEVFYKADTNKDGFLSVDEYGRLPFSGPFKAADTTGDGRISLPEFVTIRFRQFEEADTNHDYQLSVDEVVTAYEGGKQQ